MQIRMTGTCINSADTRNGHDRSGVLCLPHVPHSECAHIKTMFKKIKVDLETKTKF